MACESTKNTIKILEQSHVSPPPGSVPPTQIPLTFFDVVFLGSSPSQLLVFYHLPHPTQHFTNTIIPSLKHSLSLALRHFFPLAATLLLPPPPQEPYISFSNNSSVLLTIAESSADFNHLIANYVRDVKELHPFVPPIHLRPSCEGPTYALPVFALQVTIFPNVGLSIGTASNHVAADGKSMIHFIKSWASISKMKNVDITLDQAPSHERDLIKDPRNFKSVLLGSKYSPLWKSKKVVPLDTDLTPLDGMVRATFLLGRAQIERLKIWVSAHFTGDEVTKALHVSRFVVTCAFTWVHLVKSQSRPVPGDEDVICYFPLPVDCRNRKVFEFSVPANYFGNCIVLSIVAIKRSELVGENGIFAAAKAIATVIKEVENGASREFVDGHSDFVKAMESGNIMLVTGSPNLRLYEIDFGWGRPKKNEMVHIDNIVISLAENGEEEGGMEIGVALYKNIMDTFAASFEQGLSLLLK